MSQCAFVDEAQRKTHFDVVERDSVVQGSLSFFNIAANRYRRNDRLLPCVIFNELLDLTEIASGH